RTHENAKMAARASEAAANQGKFWKYHDKLFERRNQWMQSGQNNPKKTFRGISNDLGLNTDAIMQCYENSDNTEARNDKAQIVNKLGRLGTPVFFIGNKEKGFIKIVGAQPIQRFEEAINKIKNR
ncbi:MAG: DsbA family protein, partial [Candidatus Nanohalobium sp.]